MGYKCRVTARKRLSEMTSEERREFLRIMAEDRRTVTSKPTGIDLRLYVRIVSAVCDSLIGPQELTRAVTAVTEREAVFVAIDLAAQASGPFEMYSAEPNPVTDAPSLFGNLDQWLDEEVPERSGVPRCPIAGHSDRWRLTHSDGSLWRACAGSGGLIDQFRF